ncbi:MAG: hypothetical protein F4005_00480 [Acidimicrobiales bacterium]|nr:hypothetical protein [Acidimicrobiales bacterium]
MTEPTRDAGLDAVAIDQYQDLMNDTKRRHDFVGRLDKALDHDRGLVESAALQVRMMLENIVYACLVANGQLLDVEKLRKQWRIGKILDSLDSALPHDCWPIPLVLDKSASPFPHNPRFPGELKDRPRGDWLTKDECKTAYGKLGDLLHVRNPLHPDSPDFEGVTRELPTWCEKIAYLLGHHKIASSQQQRMWVVVVNDEGTQLTKWDQIPAPIPIRE